MSGSCPPEPALYRGWADIAAPLEVSEDSVQRYAARAFDPLPVYYDHAERPCCRADAMRDWVSRQALFYASFHALREAGKLPSQRVRGRPAAHARGARAKGSAA